MIGAVIAGPPRRLTFLRVVAASSPEPLSAAGSAATSGSATGAASCARLTGAVVDAERRSALM